MDMHRSIAVCVMLGASCDALAAAQDTNDQAGALEKNRPVIEEIVVTAQKRTENLQQVPVAVTALTAEQRERLGIGSVQDFAAFTPGMSYSNEPSRVYLRGIGRTSNSFGTEPGVAIYLDGVYTTAAAAIASSPLGTERTEILRGPQGTLYGRNTTGGAVNVTSRRPTEDFYAEFRQSFNRFYSSNTGLAISGPINDGVRYRLMGTYRWQGDQSSENVARSGDIGGKGGTIEGQLEVDVTDNLRLWGKYSYSSSVDHPVLAADYNPYDTTTETFDSLVINPLFGYEGVNPTVEDHRKFAQNTLNIVDTEAHNAILHADWDIGFATLRYVGGYATADAAVTQDLDNSARTEPFVYDGALSFLCDPVTHFGCVVSPVTDIDLDLEPTSYSNEINLISPADNRLRWILGLYQYHEKTYTLTNLHRPFDPYLVNEANPTGSYIRVESEDIAKTLAAFGQFDFDISSSVTLQAGLRYTYDDKESMSDLVELAFSGPYSTLLFGAPMFSLCQSDLCAGPESYQHDFDGVTGKVALQWQPDDDTNLFALVSTGYKSGVITDIAAQTAIPPEKLLTFEVGLKKDFGATLRLDLAAFYYDYQDMQVETVGPDPNVPGNFTAVFVSAPKARSYGFELEGIWQPNEHVDMLLSYSYLDATIRELRNVVDQSLPPAEQALQDVSGNTLPQSPKHKVAFNAGYSWYFKPGSLRLGASVTYTDKKYFDIFTTPVYLAPSYSETDLRAMWTSASGKLTLIASVSNLFDEESRNYVNLIRGATATSYVLNSQRGYGIELQRRF